MSDHYATLGVERGACPEDIKAGYRKAASRAHPDRHGGDDKAMALVNLANDVLSDPERRARYDSTGQDAPIQSLEDEARGNAMKALAEVLDSDGNIVELAQGILRRELAKCHVGIANASAGLERLLARRARVRSRSNQNLVHMLIDQRLAAVEASIAHMRRGTEVLPRAIELLNEHESDEIIILTSTTSTLWR